MRPLAKNKTSSPVQHLLQVPQWAGWDIDCSCASGKGSPKLSLLPHPQGLHFSVPSPPNSTPLEVQQVHPHHVQAKNTWKTPAGNGWRGWEDGGVSPQPTPASNSPTFLWSVWAEVVGHRERVPFPALTTLPPYFRNLQYHTQVLFHLNSGLRTRLHLGPSLLNHGHLRVSISE